MTRREELLEQSERTYKPGTKQAPTVVRFAGLEPMEFDEPEPPGPRDCRWCWFVAGALSTAFWVAVLRVIGAWL